MQTNTDSAPVRFLRRSTVEELTGLSRQTIYRYVKAGTFPKPVQIGARAVAWLASDIYAWNVERVVRARSMEATA